MELPNLDTLTFDIKGMICSRVRPIFLPMWLSACYKIPCRSWIFLQNPPSLYLRSIAAFLMQQSPVFIARYLSLKIGAPDDVGKLVRLIRNTKIGKNYLFHARNLEVGGRMSFEHVTTQSTINLRLGSIYKLEESLDPQFPSDYLSIRPGMTPEECAEAWRPMVMLLAEFQHLKHPLYRCHGQLAPGVFDAIHRYHPSCKLHIRSFRLTSLNGDVASSNELALVT